MERRCPACGSAELIPDLTIRDGTGAGYRAKYHEVEVAAKPTAFIDRGVVRAELLAPICGACGYALLFVSDHDALWRAYHVQQEGQR